jgi:hypothetical protein
MKGEFPNRTVLFYVTMLCTLLPICVLEVWSARNARPTSAYCWPISKGQSDLVTIQTLQKGAMGYYTDLNTGAFSARLIGQRHSSYKRISTCRFDSQIWVLHGDRFFFESEWVDLKKNAKSEVRQTKYKESLENFRGAYVVNNHLVCLQAGRLEATELLSGKVVDSVPFSQGRRTMFQPVNGTQSILLSESLDRNNPNSVCEQSLFTFDGTKIRKIASWSSLEDCVHIWSASTSYLASLNVDGTNTEVRDSKSGELIAEYIDDPSLIRKGVPIDQTIIWETDRGCADIVSGKTLPVPEGSRLIARDVDGQQLVTLRKKTNALLGWDCIVLDEGSGKELNRFDVPLKHCPSDRKNDSWAFLMDSNRLVIATISYGISIYDLKSGILIREFDPFIRSERCSWIAAIGFGIWCLVWLNGSAKLHPHGWLDMAVCPGLVIACCCIRNQHRNYPEFELCVCFGIFGCWILASSAWLFFGNTRWSLRFQPLLLLLGATFGIVAGLLIDITWFRSEPVDFAFGEIFLIAIYFFALVLLRYFGFRLVKVEELAHTPKPKASMFALRDLFSLTLVFAFLFTFARWMPAVNWLKATPSSWRILLMLVGMIAVPSLVAMWTATSRRSWLVRWGVLLIVLVGYEILAASLAWGVFRRELALSAAIATLFGFYAYRLRGWRLERNAIALQTDGQSHDC